MRVFVVDDDPEYLALVRRVLENDGHVVVSASRGAEAIQRSLTTEMDVLLCDLMLPDFEGTEVIRALKAQSPDLPVVVVSALSPDDWRERCLDAGATGFLQKPIALDDLREELALVQAGRAELTVWVVDSDDIHRARIRRELAGQGCRVEAFAPGATLPALGPLRPDLALVEAVGDVAVETIRALAAERVATLAFSEGISAELEEILLRAGAAMCLRKPLDTGALLIQARFLAHA